MRLKKYVTKFVKYQTDKNYRFLINASRGKYDKMPDKEYLERKFQAKMGYPLNLNAPKTFNEKLQWLKLYNRKAEYTVMVDKYLAREYVAGVIGKEYLIPLIGQWDRAEDIDFDKLPDKFVFKCNHNSGLGMYICKDKSKLTGKEIGIIRKNLTKGLKQDYYLTGREWPYKNVPRKIICEKYMTDSPESLDFTDYKFFCFDGYVDCVMVCLDRSSGETKFYFFDREWRLKRINIRGKNAPEDFTVPKPKCIDKMFDIASNLSKGLPFARVDLYQSDGHPYFGEITLFPDSGFDANLLTETDAYFGKLIDLEKIK